MSEDSVHPTLQRSPSSSRVLYAALPLITLSWLVLLTVLVIAVIPIQRFEIAPGEASRVSPRISFTAAKGGSQPTRYTSENSIRFVTAQTGQLTILTSIMGWLDPHVVVDTYNEHFGTQSPDSVRRLGYQAMVGAKQIAEYVAFTKLGLKAEIRQGKVLIEQTICAQNPAPQSACKVLDVGEVITAVDGVQTPTLVELANELSGRAVGDVVSLTVIPYSPAGSPAKKAETRKITLMESPDIKGKAIIGFTPADTRTVVLPFDVNISTAAIGGPSGGLAFTLAILDELTPGPLMGTSKQVAATGTMDETGRVGAIGALEQKAVAVRDAGATLFLVPDGQSDGEVARAQAAAGKSVKIVKVATLDQALRVLAKYGGGKLPVSTSNPSK